MKRFLSFDRLESIESLSTLGHRPAPHRKPAVHVAKTAIAFDPSTTTPNPSGDVVHASAVKPPHQVRECKWTGTPIHGQLTVSDSVGSGDSMTLVGSGSLKIGRQQITVGLGLSTHDQVGSLCLQAGDGSLLYADIVTLADGSAGNYRITQASGQFSGMTGTGYFLVRDAAFAFNPHQ